MNKLLEQYKKDLEEFENKFSKRFTDNVLKDGYGNDLTEKEATPLIKFAISHHSQSLKNLLEVLEGEVKRIKLDMDVVVCDCGEQYRESDSADLVNNLLSLITNFKKEIK